MSKLLNIVSESNFELVRSRIASILADELANQLTLNIAAKAAEESKPEPDPVLIALYDLNIASIPSKVYEERFFRPTTQELQAETMVNVVFVDAPLDENTTVSTQIGDDRYMIEAYAAGKTNSNDNADKIATLKLQRLLAIVRAILMNPNYINLGFDTSPLIVGKRICNNIQIGQPDDGGDNADAMIRGKIDLTVKVHETIEPITGVVLALNESTLKLYDSEKGYYWTNESN